MPGTVDFDVFARYYDYEYGAFDADVPMYLGFAERVGSPILELAAGTGRLLLPLARAGFQVTGIDISEALLAVAREKIRAADVESQVRLVRADMRDFALEQRFHMAFCALNSFMHLETVRGQAMALRCWRRHLQPGGLLIIDLFLPNPARLGEEDGRLMLQHTWKDETTGVTIVKQHARRVDFAEQRLDVHFIYDEISPDGTIRRTVTPFTLRYLGRFEMQLLLERSGYIVEAVYGSWDLDPLESDSDRMIFIARRDETAHG
ncbi:MAG: class I SAM-dependent methyltransferase [Anaerolineae bacterium]|nr:class I SAM-dependent methyltransferase [Anaerolineae bacterium]